MILSNLPNIIQDYKKIFTADHQPKADAYDDKYVDRMHGFSKRRLWRAEAAFAFEGLTLKADANALDVGCNNGTGTDIMADLLGIPFCGIDTSPAAIQKAKESHNQNSQDFHHYDGQTIPFDDASFDLVCSMHVIGHVADSVAFLREISRVLKPGGAARIITPSATYKLWAIVDSLVNNYLPDPTVRNYFFAKELSKAAATAGFTDLSCESFGEKPLLLSLLPKTTSYGKMRLILKAKKPSH